MFDQIHNSYAHVPATCMNCAPLRSFLGENAEELLNAAGLLNGQEGASVAQAVLDGIDADISSRRRLRRDLNKLLGILMLENAHDENRAECALAALIDPTDPVVEELCLLADGLQSAIADRDARHEHADDLALEERAAA